ncbi:MAG: hypothetical protein EZS28_039192 [Streblomastix strix]|uniref:Uncharacterized protein n=1 Tax=Streblomastix strix TaxID=222440 RepID=A0A5J4U5Q1_9EUKA|nr:MAG: hypothetical protein EZS28_039192 [Streblomastix strix]
MSKKGKKEKKAIARPSLPVVKKSREDSQLLSQITDNQHTITGINDWRATMLAKPLRVYNYQQFRPPQVAKIPDILKSKGIKLKKGMSSKQQEKIQQEILRYDDQISPFEAKLGVLGLIDDTQKPKIYGGNFPYSLQQDLLETNIRINNEGKLIFDNYIDNTQRYSSNINKGLNEPSMNLGSRSPVFTQEQQLNEMMNEGSQRQKQILSRQLDSEFANQQQATSLPQSSMLDEPPEISLGQEKLSEEQQRQIEAEMISSMNLNTVYDIGALDWGRPPINDAYGRHPFETYATGYKYDQFGNPIAYMKKPTQPIGKKNSNMKRNYIPTSQLIQTAKAQADLHKKLTKSTKNHKKK